jgi:hypothetical protein
VETVEVSFLATGPSMNIPILNQMAPIPRLTCPVDVSCHGHARLFNFIPERLSEAKMTKRHLTRVASLQSPTGIGCDVWKTPDDKQRFLVWRLHTGYLVTHIRVEDGYHNIELVVDRLEISDEPHLAPIIDPQHPLRRYISRRPGYWESIQFIATERTNRRQEHLQLRRPGYLREGGESFASAGGWGELTVGIRNDLEVSLLAEIPESD